MNGYTASTCESGYEAVPSPNPPGSLKDMICETNAQLNRARGLLDDLWRFVAEPGMEKHDPTKTAGDCMLGGMMYTLDGANEVVAQIERIMKVLGM